MEFKVRWPNHEHFLLQGANVTLTVGGTQVPLFPFPGGVEGTIPPITGDPPEAVLVVEFAPGVTSVNAPVLRVEQKFRIEPASLSGLQPGGPKPTEYVLRPKGGGTIAQTGLHPLLRSFGDTLATWWLAKVNTEVVDRTAIQPELTASLELLRASGPKAAMRLLARTDGKLPHHYLCLTPPASAAAAVTDVLAFFTTPVDTSADPDTKDALLDLKRVGNMAGRGGTFFGTPLHEPPLLKGAPVVAAIDHFTPNPPLPSGRHTNNLVLARRWEEALKTSGKHVALILPVPAGGSHNTAASGELPQQLRQVHAALVGTGDIAAPPGTELGRPQLGVAAHSQGGPALFKALQESAKDAFKEIWLFEAQGASGGIATLAQTVGANVLFAGWEVANVLKAETAAKAHPKLAGRIAPQLPDKRLDATATPAELASSSPLFKHMVEGIANPVTTWEPPIFELPNHETYDERFRALHQLIVQGNDADGDHFLAKALKRSSFR
jgi:hypothetical protein